MNKLLKTFSMLAALAFFSTACGAQVVQAQPVEAVAPKVVTYQAVLGKPVNTRDVADFIASNNCTASGQAQLCRSVGLVLWTDNSQIVEKVYVNLGSSDNFAAYKGELPLGLATNNTMADVEQKLGQPVEIHAPQAGWKPGLPDEGGTPDHIHYWAIYRRFGLTIIYNSPSADDKNATIHAILVSR